MTNVIDGLSKRLDDLPTDVLEDAITAFKLIAERNGGKMMRGKYQLTAKPGKRRVADGVASVVMEGVPSGFWVWKEFGTKQHEIRPKAKKRRRRKGKRSFKVPGPMGSARSSGVRGGGVNPGHHRRGSGRRRWSRPTTRSPTSSNADYRRR